jgi:hypothetical protein
MKFNREQALEIFDNFIFIMDDQLEWLESEAKKAGIILKQEPEYLSNLENLFDYLSNNENDDTIEGLIIAFARYLGETFINHYGGKWKLSLENEKNVYFNTPVIAEYNSINNLEFSPIFAIRAYSIHKEKGTLKSIVNETIKPTELDLTDLIAMEKKPG